MSSLWAQLQAHRTPGAAHPNSFVLPFLSEGRCYFNPSLVREPQLTFIDTKEKPFLCRCGAAFARRDLLTRHQRITLHDGITPGPSPPGAVERTPTEPGLAAATDGFSLQGMSVDQWAGQQPQSPEQIHQAHDDSGLGRYQQDVPQPYHQGLLSPQLFENGECTFRVPRVARILTRSS